MTNDFFFENPDYVLGWMQNNACDNPYITIICYMRFLPYIVHGDCVVE